MVNLSTAGVACVGACTLAGGVAIGYFMQQLKPSKAPALPADAKEVPLTGDDKKDFLAVFAELTKELVASFGPYEFPPRAAKYIQEMMDYNVPHGKLTRGLTVISTLKSLKGDKFTSVDFRRAAVLGWCVEWLQAMFLVMDDIMDDSQTRRGQPCWYLKPDVKMNAINDGLILEAHIYLMLKRYFGEDAEYVALVELFHEVTHQTAMGQFLDLTTADPHKVDFSLFSLDVYSKIVIYKTAYYSFYLPVACGMVLGGITDENLFGQAREICVEMGHLFQVQDDYLDCYGHPDTIGKIGTDIYDNKCSWLVNTALKLASPAQMKVLEENYAKKDKECEKKVKAVYVELGLEAKFKAHEEASNKVLLERIAQIETMPTTIFTKLLGKIYQRKK